MYRFFSTASCLLAGTGSLACGSEEPSAPAASWQVVQDALPSALLSVWGTSTNDVWSVGADAGDGPLVLHLEGGRWSRLETGASGDLWWVFGFEAGPIYMGGAGGLILRYEAGAFTRMDTPGSGVVFGLWGNTPDEMWAVGGEAGGSQGAFAWRLGAGSWAPVPGFPSELAETDALWKVFGRGGNDVWMVGTGGKMLHWDGAALRAGFAGLAESLFTVHGNSQRYATVGGFGTGLLLEQAVGAAAADPWVARGPSGAPSLIGIYLTENDGYAVGEFGYVARRDTTAWVREETGLDVLFGSRSLHSVWVDPAGGAWTVGGQVRVPPLTEGIMLHRGESVPSGLE